jgi:hypothetical protein
MAVENPYPWEINRAEYRSPLIDTIRIAICCYRYTICSAICPSIWLHKLCSLRPHRACSCGCHKDVGVFTVTIRIDAKLSIKIPCYLTRVVEILAHNAAWATTFQQQNCFGEVLTWKVLYRTCIDTLKLCVPVIVSNLSYRWYRYRP